MRLRPLRGEPLALDLVDTVWVEHGTRLDQFDDSEGVRAWLSEHGLPGGDEPDRVRGPLVEARDAVRDALEGRGPDRLNDVLDRGSCRPRLGPDGPSESVVIEDAAWHAPWVAAASFVRLLGERPDRVRRCANPECTLWFLDASKNGSRRWCSMEVCGNRAKVGRFNQRHRTSA